MIVYISHITIPKEISIGFMTNALSISVAVSSVTLVGFVIVGRRKFD